MVSWNLVNNVTVDFQRIATPNAVTRKHANSKEVQFVRLEVAVI
jgi:hypothetical protein